MKSNIRMTIWAATVLLAVSFSGCAANLYFPADSFGDGAGQRAVMYAHMSRNLNAVLTNPRLRAAIPTESGEMILARGKVLLRISGPHCPGKTLQDRVELWQRLRERAAQAGVRAEYVDFDRAHDPHAEQWALRVRRTERLMTHGAARVEFDRYWGLYCYDAPTKTWTLESAARTANGRHQIESQTIRENGWLWQLVPCMPAIVMVRDGRATAYICGTPPDEVQVPEFSEWAKREWEKRRTDRAGFDRDMAGPMTSGLRTMGEKVAAQIEERLGGFQ